MARGTGSRDILRASSISSGRTLKRTVLSVSGERAPLPVPADRSLRLVRASVSDIYTRCQRSDTRCDLSEPVTRVSLDLPTFPSNNSRR